MHKLLLKKRKGESGARIEAISNPRLGLDILRRTGVRLDLLAQLSNENAQIFRLLHAVGSPYGRQQGSVSDHAVGVLGEIEQQIEFFGREVNLFTANPDLVRFLIDAKITDLDDL